mgnify:FL=1
MERNLVYFVSDVHLGLATKDPRERENRFVSWLKSIPREKTSALYLLGDIWDFWYEYRDVVPREGARVVAQLVDLMDKGVEVFFFEGNHDIWTFSFFEELGMKKCFQPCFTEIGGKSFCIGHGDGLGDTKLSYRLMLKVFHNKVAQSLFNALHPWLAYRFGLSWSNSNRRTHEPYTFKGESEPLYKYAVGLEDRRHSDFYIFGHYHDSASLTMASGSRFFLVKDWMDGGCPHLVFDKTSGVLYCSGVQPE